MKVLFVSQHFDPETFRGNDVAYYLAQQGVDVTVITGIPNYPKGKFFDGYGLFKRRHETKNGVNIIRVPIFPRGNNPLSIAVNYFSYAINASVYTLFHLIRHKYDICFVQQLSPVIMSWPGILFKKLTKKKLVTWVLDLWPESLKSGGGINNKHVLKIFEVFTKWEYNNSDLILTSSKDFNKDILSKGDYKDKLAYFPQWADISEDDRIMDIPPLPEGFKVVFTGNVGESQDFENIIEAMRQLPNDDIKLIIVGDGRKYQWVLNKVKELHLENRVFPMGRFPKEYMSAFLSKADALLFCLKDQPIFSLTVPAKTQSYMAMHKPIISMINGAGRKLIEEAKCGLAVPAESPAELAKAMIAMKELPDSEKDEMGRNGYKYYLDNFEKESCLSNLLGILNEQIKKP